MSFSALIITHRRDELLWKCLDSLRPPVEDWQLVLVANGFSLSEKTLELARSLCSDVEIMTLPDVTTPGKARNEGLKVCRHDWIFFIDDDAYLPPHYFGLVLPLIENGQMDVLGGPDTPPRGMSGFSESLAIALSSPFCTGGTYFRHQIVGSKIEKADENKLTSCNLWIRKSALEGVNFPTDYLRGEETALLAQIAAEGARMFYLPTMWVYHHRRKKLQELWSPTFMAGRFRARLQRQFTHSKRAYFWLPSIFVLLHITVFLDTETFITLVRIYGTLVFALSLALCARRKRTGLVLHVSFLHWFIVFNFGLGFIFEYLGGSWLSTKN